jgi:hypothetical protein
MLGFEGLYSGFLAGRLERVYFLRLAFEGLYL